MEIGGTVAFQRLNVLVHYLEEKRELSVRNFLMMVFWRWFHLVVGIFREDNPSETNSSLRFKVLTQALIDRLTRRKWVGETDNKKPCLFLLLLP